MADIDLAAIARKIVARDIDDLFANRDDVYEALDAAEPGICGDLTGAEIAEMLAPLMAELRIVRGEVTGERRIDVATACCAPLAQALAAATERLAYLVTNMETRIDVAAEKLAAPLVRAAKQAAGERIAVAEYAVQRAGDHAREVERESNRMRSELVSQRNEARDNLARIDAVANADRAARNAMQQQRDVALAEVARLRAAAGETTADKDVEVWCHHYRVPALYAADEGCSLCQGRHGHVTLAEAAKTCTHGADCESHLGASGVHNYDRLPEFDVDAALADGGSVTITHHAGEDGGAAHFFASVVDIDGVEIGCGSSTGTAVDALSRISDVRLIEVVDEMPL